MPITFNVIPRKNIQKPNDPAKYYANIIGDGKTTLSDLAKHASSTSTVSKADILAALETVEVEEACFAKSESVVLPSPIILA